jgi:S-formylglutathione hydrolase FrmB
MTTVTPFSNRQCCAERRRSIDRATTTPNWRGLLTVLPFWVALIGTAVPAAGKDFDTITFHAQHLGGKEVPLSVILPAGYDASEKRYPVLYLLHGYTAHYSDWVANTHIIQYARRYQEIIAMPETGTSWYVNNYANPQLKWQDYFIYDVIPYVDQHYRTRANRRGRAIAGTSMGGYGALFLGLKYHAMFAAAASLSGVVTTPEPSFVQYVTSKLDEQVIESDFGPFGSQARDENDLFKRVRQVPPSAMPELYLSIGTSDKYLGTNREFVKLLDSMGVDLRYRELPGGHDWRLWDAELETVLAFQADAIWPSSEGNP